MAQFSQRCARLFADLLSRSFLDRSWAPFWSISDGFWMNFNGFWHNFSMHFRFVCNKICRLPKKSLGEKSCIPGPFLGVYFCSFSESLEKVKQDQIRSNKINQDQTRSMKRTLGINRHAQFATMEHRSPAHNAARRTLLAILLACYAFKSKVLRKCPEPPRTDKNQKLTNADN